MEYIDVLHYKKLYLVHVISPNTATLRVHNIAIALQKFTIWYLYRLVNL